MDDGNQELWYTIFAKGHPALKKFQQFHQRLPAPPRCRMCYAPFSSVGGMLMRFMKKGPSPRNPHYCNACDAFIAAHPGGAEVEMSMVLVDVRDSTALAEKIGPSEFSKAMNRFYRAVANAINDEDGFILGVAGDEVVSVFPPGFCGDDHAQKAIRAAENVLRLTIPAGRKGEHLHFGVGVHSGVVHIGTTSTASAGAQEVTALGDCVNTAARLASAALAEEALISEESCSASHLPLERLERRVVDLKGKSVPVSIRVLHGNGSAEQREAVPS